MHISSLTISNNTCYVHQAAKCGNSNRSPTPSFLRIPETVAHSLYWSAQIECMLVPTALSAEPVSIELCRIICWTQELWDSGSGDYKECHSLWCDTMLLCNELQTVYKTKWPSRQQPLTLWENHLWPDSDDSDTKHWTTQSNTCEYNVHFYNASN